MRFLAAYVFAVCVAASAARASDVAFYFDAWPCTPGVDCFVGSHGTSNAPGPANADFQRFFGVPGATFAWSGSSNANGTWFGTVDEAALHIHTSYLWRGSELICCTIDQPYAIVDGNGRDHFIGYDPNEVSNAGQPLFPAFIATPGGPFALSPLDYGITPEALALLGADIASVRLVAIDDEDNILATWSGGWLQLVPAEFTPQPTPEPASAWLVLAGAFAICARGRRDRFAKRTAA